MEQSFECAALRCMLGGVSVPELPQIDYFPQNGRKVGRLGEAEQAEVRLGVVEGEQEVRDIAVQA